MVYSIGLRLTVQAPKSVLSPIPTRLVSTCLRPKPSQTKLFSTSSLRLLPSPTWYTQRRAPQAVTASTHAFSQLHLTTRRLSTTTAVRNTPRPTPASCSPSQPSKQPLSEDILTIPNLLTISRLALTPYIGYLVATHHFVPAVSLLFIASLTDVLDGWLARRTGKYTVFGSIADPAADKALVTTMVISLAMSGMLPWVMATIILGRDAGLVISAFVIRYKTLAEPKTFSRYFNPKLPSATVTPTQISKYNTFLQLLLLGLLTLYPIVFPNQGSPGMSFSSNAEAVKAADVEAGTKAEPEAVKEARTKLAEKGLISQDAKLWVDRSITTLMWITAATTIWSGLGYIGGAGTHKVLARAQNMSTKVKQSLKKPPTSPP